MSLLYEAKSVLRTTQAVRGRAGGEPRGRGHEAQRNMAGKPTATVTARGHLEKSAKAGGGMRGVFPDARQWSFLIHNREKKDVLVLVV